MLEIKRKPNSSGGRTTSAPRSALNEAGHASPDDHYPIAHRAAHDAAAVPAPSMASRKHPPLIEPSLNDIKDHQTKLPVITGEARCKGSLNLDGVACGQLGGSGGTLSVRQRRELFSASRSSPVK